MALAHTCVSAWSKTHRAFSSAGSPTQGHHGTRKRALQAKAATLDTDVTIAASQQLLSYAVLISAEGFWARTRMEPQPGRPSILPVVAAAGSMVALTALLQVEALQFPTQVAGLAVSTAIFAFYLKRSIDVRDPTGQAWPGPKASPAGMALVAFFCFNIFLQGLRT